MSAQMAPVPVIMFSADAQVSSEARRNESERSQAAHFSSVLPKPFDLDELVRVVALAVSQSLPWVAGRPFVVAEAVSQSPFRSDA